MSMTHLMKKAENVNKTYTPTTLPNVYIHNVRSLNSDKFNELQLLANKYDLIMLTESWLNKNKESLYNLDGFDLHVCHRGNGRTGGGVAVYAKKHLSINKLTEYKTRHVSAYWFLHKSPSNNPIIYANIYHPPGLAKNIKDDTINHIISTVSKQLKSHPDAKLFICGDLNDLDINQITAMLPVQQIVNFTTRGDATLDVILTDIQEHIESGCKKLPPIQNNDHCAIEVPSSTRIKLPKYVTINKREITPTNKIALTAELQATDWRSVYNCKSVHSKVEIFHKKVQTLFDKHCPVRRVRVPRERPVLSNHLIPKPRRAKQRAHKNKNPSWKALSKLLTIQMRNQLKRRTDEKVNSTVHGSKTWWKNVNDLTGEAQEKSHCAPLINMDDSWLSIPDFVEKLNEYYLDGHDVALDFPVFPTNDSREIQLTNELEVYNQLMNINTQKASNSEDFPSWISKNNAHLLSQPITHIVNHVLTTGEFPHLWKKAEISPLNKVRSPKTFKDLRPISLLFHLGKITEKIITKQIRSQLPVLTDQYAYTKDLGTADALVKFSSDISMNLDNSDNIAIQALLLDFSKAFDRMRPDFVLHKLLKLNIQPSLVKVVEGFFTSRQQRVRYNCQFSQYRSSHIGVPQGTIMGPVLWNVFVHDLCPSIPHIKYADDTTVYSPVNRHSVAISDSSSHKATINFTENPLQLAASYAVDWCADNSMLLNTSKSVAITFTLQKNITSNPISIKEVDICEKSDVKLLGVTFDQHMRFSNHVDNTIDKTRPAVHALIKLRKAGVSASSLSLFYQARILPI